MTGVVADVDGAATILEKLFGHEAIVRTHDRLIIRAGRNQEFVLMSIAAATEAFAGIDIPIETDVGHLCSVMIRVNNLNGTKAFFASQGIEYMMTSRDTIRTFPHDACGVLLEFI